MGGWKRYGVRGFTLYGVWLLLSGRYEPLHLVLGAGSVAVVLWINRHFAPALSEPRETPVHLFLFRAIRYVFWLLWETILSGWHIGRMILSPALPIAPVLVRFRSRQPNDMAKLILAHSINLTPGTLAIEIRGDEYLVYALTKQTLEGLADETMQRMVARLFVEAPSDVVMDVRIEPRR